MPGWSPRCRLVRGAASLARALLEHEGVNTLTQVRFSRRFLLRSTAVGAAAMALGGLCGSWRRRATRLPPSPTHALDADQAAILTAVAETLLPPAPGFPTVQEVRLVERIDAKLATVPAEDLEDVRSLLTAFEYGAPVLGPAAGRFTALSDAARERYLAGWERSRLAFKRTGFHALKYLVLLYYYDSPRAWRKLRYTGPQIPRLGEDKELP